MKVLTKLLCLAAVTALAASAGTRIRDTLFDARGARATGTCVIQWGPFLTQQGKAIGAGTKRYVVRNGVLDVELEATEGAAPHGSAYTVRCSFAGSVPGAVERWAVPQSDAAVSLTQVRVTPTLPAPGAAVAVADVAGLNEELADRPVRGPNWVPFRVAVIDSGGQLGAANGALSDCVKVDGSAGPCGDGSGSPGAPGSFVANVRPTWQDDLIMTLPDLPSPPQSVACYVNGLRHTYGVDYTVSGSSITWSNAHFLLFANARLFQDPAFVVTCDYWR